MKSNYFMPKKSFNNVNKYSACSVFDVSKSPPCNATGCFTKITSLPCASKSLSVFTVIPLVRAAQFAEPFVRNGLRRREVNVPDTALYERYRALAAEERPDVIFGGRLGEYKYYDMDKVIASALALADKELG